MARTARPWFRKQTGWWMVTLRGKQQKLAEGRDNKKAALKRYHELQLLMAEAPESADVRVASVCDAFLQWSERHQAAETYRGYSFYVQSFCEACGFLLVTDLRPHHITKWIAVGLLSIVSLCIMRTFDLGLFATNGRAFSVASGHCWASRQRHVARVLPAI